MEKQLEFIATFAKDKITEIFFMTNKPCKVFDAMPHRKSPVPHNPSLRHNYHKPRRAASHHHTDLKQQKKRAT